MKILSSIILALVLLAGVIFIIKGSQKKEITTQDLKQQVLSGEAILSEAGFLLNETKKHKTTGSFVSVHTDGLLQQLQQSEQTLNKNPLQSDIKPQGKKQMQLITKAKIVLTNLKSNPDDKKTVTQTQQEIAELFGQETALEKVL